MVSQWTTLKAGYLVQKKVRARKMEGQNVSTYKLNNATIRIHGTTDQDRLKAAATLFLKKAEMQKQKKAGDKSA